MPKAYTPDEIRDISEVVYRIRLEDDCKTNVERMLAKDREKDPDDGGKKLRGRAAAYDATVKACLQALGLMEPGAQLKYLQTKGLQGPMASRE